MVTVMGRDKEGLRDLTVMLTEASVGQPRRTKLLSRNEGTVKRLIHHSW